MIRWPLLALLPLSLLGIVPLALPPLYAQTSPENAARLQAYRQEIEELKNMGPADTEFRANAGLAFTQKLPEWAGLSRGADIDKDLIKPFEAAQTELVKDRLQQNWELRRQQIKQIQQRQNHLRTIEQGHRNTEDQAATRLREIREARIEKNNRLDNRLKAEQKQLRQQLASARIEGQKVRETRLNLQNSIKSDEVRALQRSLAADRQKYNMLQKSAARGEAWSNKGSFIVGAIMSGISAELEENALAEQEGRPPSKLNKATNFVKNISGYAAISGAYTNIQIAETEGYIKTLETYEALGYDITSANVQRWAANAATTAKIRATVYEGAKLAPIAGDLISIKEGFDAAGEAYVAAEEAGYTSANNEEVQFQTSLRAAMGVEGRVKRLETLGDQARLLIASMGNLKGQILTMEAGASAQREQIREALQLIEAYQRQTESLSGSGATGLEGPALDALLTGFNQVKKTADAQSGHLQRIKKEHQSGQLTTAGVATQVQFISAHLEPALADYTRLQQDLVRLEELAASAELAAQAPQAVEFLRRSKVVMEQQGEHSSQLYQTYRTQANHLEELLKEVQTLRGEMTKALSYAGTSTHLQPEHRDRISAALERANRVSLDQTAARKALDEVRGLRNSSDLVGALATLDQLPTAPDSSETAALATRAQEALATLTAPRQAAGDSLERAQNLLNELTALAGNAQPLEVDAAPKTTPQRAGTTQSGLFAGRNHLHLTPEDIRRILTNRNEDKFYTSSSFFGFSTYDFPPQVKPWDHCKQVTDTFCPRDNKLYKILEEGKTQRSWRGSQKAAPYWIAYQLKDFDATLSINKRWTRQLQDDFYLKSDIDNARSRNEGVEVYSVSVAHADEALAYIRTNQTGQTTATLLARKDQLIIRANGSIECWAGPLDQQEEQRKLHESHLRNPEPWVMEQMGKQLVTRCKEWNARQIDILVTLFEPLLAEAAPVVTQINQSLYLQPITFDLNFSGLTAENMNQKTQLNDDSGAVLNFSNKWQSRRGDRTDDFFERYNVQISWENDVHYSKSLTDIFARFDEASNASVEHYLKHPSIERRERKVNLPGADFARMAGSNSMRHRTVDDFRAVQLWEQLYFRIANIRVHIESTTTLPPGSQQTRIIEIAEAIAAVINKSPKGLKSGH